MALEPPFVGPIYWLNIQNFHQDLQAQEIQPAFCAEQCQFFDALPALLEELDIVRSSSKLKLQRRTLRIMFCDSM